MPPPSAAFPGPSTSSPAKASTSSSSQQSSPPAGSSDSNKKGEEEELDPSKLRRPLAAMLPEKYKDTDVRELFPEFRPGKVLRFSRLFPIKASHKPRIWKNVRKKKLVQQAEEEAQANKDKPKGE